MKNKVVVTLDPIEFEDFIWMSYRYCIGRKTIAASNHANTIFNLLLKYPNLLSDERKEFMAKDIRKSILDIIRWNKFIKITNLYIGDDDWDMYSNILVASNSCEYKCDAIYTLDAASKTVTWNVVEKDPNDYVSFDDMYHDLIPWVKLSNWLDKKCHKSIRVDEPNTDPIICYPYATMINGKYEMVWARVDVSDVYINSYITPEFITNIDDIK
jgi:hypothetical protein